jgi:hypothetical protein
MEANMGAIDKRIRLGIAAIIAVLYFMKIITGTLALVLLIVGIIFTLTSFVSFCPLYKIVGINTCKVK